MDAATDRAATKSKPRERLLETASRLFYAEGIQAVGVDRLIAEGGVTKATFYRHFPGKDDLVLAYLRGRDAAIRAQFAAGTARVGSPQQALDLLVAGIAEETCGAGFRGCPFINAAAEYPDPRHPVRRAVEEHRAWFRDALASLAAACGHPDPSAAAALLVLLRDGAMVGGYLDGPAVSDALAHGVHAVLGRPASAHQAESAA
ncbi:TetR family transcriptional regulator [Streptomyces incarnatus]|uniref:TetR family transcriptional regulator n=1 Tax=Streptomyces incarnatus TaxID=665007 RepID=A0ABN4GE73_9ACTN|nr:TetR/AcrR family transcriptional regulator [Streptomyces incarnatus]AKJ09903.1 TetR family transcriptional regulator [Streptomyces incarnatus]